MAPTKDGAKAGKKPAPKKIGDKKEKAGEGEKVC